MRAEQMRPHCPAGLAALAGAALAGATLLVTGCGGGSPAAAARASHGLPSAAMLDSDASCMRSHGVPDFYWSRATARAAGPSSAASTSADLLKIGPWVAPANPSSPRFQAAIKACNHLLPLPQLSPVQQQSVLHRLLAQAACIRAHGFPGYPDPSVNSNGIVQPTLPPGIDTSSAQFQAAQQKCTGG